MNSCQVQPTRTKTHLKFGSPSLGLLLVAALAAAAPAAARAAAYGNYLIDNPAFGRGASAYGEASSGAAVDYNQPVMVGGNTDGQIQFTYGVFNDTNATPKFGGAGISGGFYFAPSVTLMAGYTLSWVQTVTTPTTGTSGTSTFNLPKSNAGTYADTTTTTSPAYPHLSVTTVNGTPAPFGLGATAPNVAMQDFPNRPFTATAQTWQAELALVAIADTAGVGGVITVDVIDSFTWGFNIAANAATATASNPAGWGTATANFISTENSFFSGMSPMVGGNAGVATTKYNFVNDPNVFVVPEPSAWLLGLLGASLAFTATNRTRQIRGVIT